MSEEEGEDVVSCEFEFASGRLKSRAPKLSLQLLKLEELGDDDRVGDILTLWTVKHWIHLVELGQFKYVQAGHRHLLYEYILFLSLFTISGAIWKKRSDIKRETKNHEVDLCDLNVEKEVKNDLNTAWFAAKLRKNLLEDHSQFLAQSNQTKGTFFRHNYKLFLFKPNAAPQSHNLVINIKLCKKQN